jgi:hypothetical protein
MSGGPLIAIVQAEIMRTWKPAGVIISGPNPGDVPDQDFIPGFEVIRARPIHFIKPMALSITIAGHKPTFDNWIAVTPYSIRQLWLRATP